MYWLSWQILCLYNTTAILVTYFWLNSVDVTLAVASFNQNLVMSYILLLRKELTTSWQLDNSFFKVRLQIGIIWSPLLLSWQNFVFESTIPSAGPHCKIFYIIFFGRLPSLIPVQQRHHLVQLVVMVELAAAAKKEKNGKGEKIEVKFVRV